MDFPALFCGLDPGKTGAIGLRSADGAFQAVHPFPETEREIYDLIAEYAPAIQMAWLESVHGFPQQGRSSIFTFGTSYGLLRGFLIALKIPFEEVGPTKWTRTLGLVGGGTGPQKKRFHRVRAQELFPRLELSDRTADAILIAEYGRRQAIGYVVEEERLVLK